MTTLFITPQEVDKAKEMTKSLDDIKIYNKLECNNNYLGWLGEYKFSQLLQMKGITYEWNEFVKADYSKPDFIINNRSIDVKTTFSESLWVQKADWDFYVLAFMERDLSSICFSGFLDKSNIEKYINKDKYKVIRGNRVDTCVPYEKTRILNELWGLL